MSNVWIKKRAKNENLDSFSYATLVLSHLSLLTFSLGLRNKTHSSNVAKQVH